MRVIIMLVALVSLAVATAPATALELVDDQEMAATSGANINWHYDCLFEGCPQHPCPWYNCKQAEWNPTICERLMINWDESYFKECVWAEVGMVCEVRPPGAPDVHCGFYQTSGKVEGKDCDDRQCSETSWPTCPGDNCYGGYPA